MPDSVIVEVAVPASALAMHETLATAPGLVIEIERVVAHERGSLTPYFWVRGDDVDAFESVADDDPTVAEVQRLDDHDRGTLFRATWESETDSIAHASLETGAVILEAIGHDDEWELRLRFDTYRDVTGFRESCEAADIPFEVTRVYNPSSPKAGGQFGVTPKQREALVAALGAGFYAVPRSSSMIDLSDELEISQQAFSTLIRRAHGNLVNNVLTVETIDLDD